MHQDFWRNGRDCSAPKKDGRTILPFNSDGDTLLILALILLLQREGSDPILTVALLYILS